MVQLAYPLNLIVVLFVKYNNDCSEQMKVLLQQLAPAIPMIEILILMIRVDYQGHWQQLNYQIRNAHEVVIHFHVPFMLFVFEPMERPHFKSQSSVKNCHENENQHRKEYVNYGIN